MLESVLPSRLQGACRKIAVCLCLVMLLAYQPSADEIIEAEDIVQQIAPIQSGLNRSRGIGIEEVALIDDFRRVALPAIEFEFASDRLTSRALRQLAELSMALGAEALQPSFFAVQGHTDSVGSEIYNRELSLRRAGAVKLHLSQERGLSADRFVEVGLGEGFPLAGIPPDNERNRRVEIVNLGMGQPHVVAPASEEGWTQAKRALLIGIGDYEHISRLNGPVNDALQMKSFVSDDLRYAEKDIRLLLDAEATRSSILAAIEDWLIEQTGPGDEVFLYFSGHGFYQPDDNQDEADGLDETWVPVDVTVEADGSIRGMITDDDISMQLARLAGRQVYIVIDACHSGTATRSTGDWRYVKSPRLPDGQPIRLPGASNRTRGVENTEFQPEQFVSSNDPGVTVWTAVRADQKALIDAEAQRNPGSVFTRRLLWGVRDGRADANRDNIVTRRELHDYVLRESSSYCERQIDICRRGLTPQFYATTAQVQKPVFGQTHKYLARAASLAKDILISPTDSTGILSDDRVRLGMKPGTKVRVGTELEIVIDSDRDGYLVLLDIDADGRLVQIFPNEPSLKAGITQQIRAGQPITIPGNSAGFRYRATPPVGHGILIAALFAENPQVTNLVSRYKDLSIVPHSEAYLVELGEALRSNAARQAEGNQQGWLMGKIEYEIVSQ